MSMSEQVKEIMPHLKEGGTYLFEHKRKGPFIGVYRGIKATKPNDPEDTIFFEVDAYTEDGSGQERLANAFEYIEGRKMRPVYSKKYIRPSLLNTVTYPSSTVQKQMAEVFEATRKKSEAQAEALGLEAPIFPTLSLPTEKAFSQLKGSVAAPPKGNSKLYAALALGVMIAASAVAYLAGIGG